MQSRTVTAEGQRRAGRRGDGPRDTQALSKRVVDEEGVAKVRAGAPEQADLLDAADVFGLLGDPGRLRLLVALLAAGELCVGDLAAVSGMTESSVSHALRLLRAHRVVTVVRRGRMAFYRLDDGHVRMLLQLGLTHTRHTDPVHPERSGTRR